MLCPLLLERRQWCHIHLPGWQLGLYVKPHWCSSSSSLACPVIWGRRYSWLASSAILPCLLSCSLSTPPLSYLSYTHLSTFPPAWCSCEVELVDGFPTLADICSSNCSLLTASLPSSLPWQTDAMIAHARRMRGSKRRLGENISLLPYTHSHSRICSQPHGMHLCTPCLYLVELLSPGLFQAYTCPSWKWPSKHASTILNDVLLHTKKSYTTEFALL